MHGNNKGGEEYKLPYLGVSGVELRMLAERAEAVGSETGEPEQFAIAGVLFVLAGALGDPDTLDEINTMVGEIALREKRRAREQKRQNRRVADAMGWDGYSIDANYVWPAQDYEVSERVEEPEDPTFDIYPSRRPFFTDEF